MVVEIPRLTGPRVVLRKLKKANALDVWRNGNNRSVARYSFRPYPYTLEQAQQFIRGARRGARNGTRCHLGIELRSRPGVIGVVGLFSIDYQNKNAEIGCSLGKPYWGQGLMKEAMQVMLGYAFQRLGLRRVYAYISIHNIPPQRLVESLGFTREGLLRKCRFRKGRFRDYYVYGMLREEFRSRGRR